MGNDGVEVLEPRAPRQRGANTIDICYEGRRIARAPARYFNWKIAATHALYRVDDLKN